MDRLSFALPASTSPVPRALAANYRMLVASRHLRVDECGLSTFDLRVGPDPRPPSSSGLGCVASQFFVDFGQQLVYHLRRVDPHEPAKETPPLPSNSTLGRIREPVHARDADPHMPLRLCTRNSGDVAPDVRLG